MFSTASPPHAPYFLPVSFVCFIGVFVNEDGGAMQVQAPESTVTVVRAAGGMRACAESQGKRPLLQDKFCELLWIVFLMLDFNGNAKISL